MDMYVLYLLYYWCLSGMTCETLMNIYQMRSGPQILQKGKGLL
jgi:hypothetical protein